ncbi:starvation-inducible DNA-binding protein [Roseivirga pacifica]|uniref:Starvation-inducible DNA-binding protein n=2 Tax=Roseivirga pacifica TaxID=1267423 RepID=A0A1I0RJK1_9BACT|nr:Dps family protein [Roseivirga pacifica]MCO6357832.1 DNA starvation/stationary phase protection protein [Roseivirga pacifica]MCO6366084.1 DNA starvation/stationary phase protection protein [Roseivirga pacifica]MCO6371412.1 DNA starvation/stationary phase protection protein [Roseivirga pacifica]MCO6375416.1 DNA starvation/stationary phase protection protein [Roseivirga pacifica]MCO6378790.1 DNA starvation/stationary phase protection protein [Roseivirga pacifica]|tara:strand:+ start:173 stop:622 length:450 start_codon:yes stop_codon:yes gene_type:complete
MEKSTNMTVVEKLNQLLINYQVHYQNLRLFHWNVKGPFFFVLHDKFEELYRDAAEKIDEVAERVLALGGTPKGSLKNIVSNADVESHEEQMEANEMVNSIISANKKLIENLNGVLTTAEEAGDEGTLDIFTSYIQELEKQNWMFKAYLK